MDDLALQQELRQLFEMDSQTYLQTYVSTVANLNPDSWQEDINAVYRAIHTIKGSAATVGFGAVQKVSAVLEDLLSDLRYLDPAPELADGGLINILEEAGELLIASLQMDQEQIPTTSIERIEELRRQMQRQYLPDWNEMVLAQQEFAEQGFDLVTLDLDMALDELPETGAVPASAVQSAQEAMTALREIGAELQMTTGWTKLLDRAESLIALPTVAEWRAQWRPYLKELKESAKRGGKELPKPPAPKPAVVSDPMADELRHLFNIDTERDVQTYVSTVQALNDDSWKQDITQLYRSIHTIKGNAVTVGAESIRQIAAVLEDLLSDLRYLETAPPLADGRLQQILTEAGELLIGSLQQGDADQTAAIVQRIVSLHTQVKETFLAEWNEQRQLWQEFAVQGFDLVVLDLEMAIEQLPETGSVPDQAVEIAQMTLQQLLELGTDMGFTPQWQERIQEGMALISLPLAEWRKQWTPYLQMLKESAKLGGIKPKVKEKPKETIEQEFARVARVPPKPKTSETAPDIQVPVPLERLDRSSQYLIETLMTTRAAQGFYQAVQNNLLPLVSLAQDSVQYITQLRAVQDDYALSDSAQNRSGLQLEGYRKGYTAINRLLEISLRLIELGSETGEFARRTTDSLQKLDASLRNLQQTIETSRLVPFESLAFRARGILRDLTNRMGKPAQMVVSGEKIEMDAGTLRNLEPVLLHMIRNSFDHGLESKEDREKVGKPPTGRIELALARRGSSFVLQIKDDGKGIDPQKISSIAQSKGLPLIDTSTPEKLLQVICQPGFTSAKAVSDVSGRGVGMDVVASQVAAMGGHISLNSKIGVGTTFTIQIPVPQMLVRCMILQSGALQFALPTAEIFTTMLLGDLLWEQVHNPAYALEIVEDTGKVPAIDLYQYWQGDMTPRPMTPTTIAVRAKLPDANEGIWLVADSLVGQSDLVVSSIPYPLTAPIGLVGVSLMPNGKMIPVMDVIALIETLVTKQRSDLFIAPIEVESPTRSASCQILVVDDAALMRRRIEGSLSSQGYDVRTCNDGLEAFEWMQANQPPLLLITDIEMPRMDGLTLIDRCRQMGYDMPILVISSRLAEEWSRETKRLGATDFLTKGFNTPELLNKVAELLNK
jgi:chemotaxis protein histidine kinase CheA/CheY-like chemotaxis protein